MRFRTELSALLLLALACTKEKGRVDPDNNYPVNIGRIIARKCATQGCHTSSGKGAAAGLSLQTWGELFNGSRGGAVVIPYRPDFSTFCFFTNTNPQLGPLQSPTMPLGREPLPEEEYLALKSWISSGAPDREGMIKSAGSKKIYIANQLCDEVTIADAGTGMPLRYITVGNAPATEFPFQLSVTPDNQHWLVSFFSPTGLVQKYSAITDALEAELKLGTGFWSTFAVDGNSKLAYFVDNDSPGRIACVDIEQMKLLSVYPFSLDYPRGAALHPTLKKLYIGTEFGNFIYIIDISDPLQPQLSQKIIDGSNTINEAYSLAPHHFEFSADGSMCFISCEGSSEIKVLQTNSDKIVASIALPAGPYLSKLSRSGKLFVSCPYDSVSFRDNIGSVVVITASDRSIAEIIPTGFQPYGLAIDEEAQTVTVANANRHGKGPAPHHTSSCAGRNGYLTFIDMKTLNLVPDKKYELAVFPRSVAMKAK